MNAKKGLSLALALLMSVSLLSACKKDDNVDNSSNGSSSADSNFNKTGLPIVKEKITITAMGQKDPGATEWNDLELFKKVEQLTNIHFEFELAETATYTEKKNLALNSNDYPDVFLRAGTVADEETYGPQGIFLDLTKLIADYAPNLTKRMSEHKELKPSITATDGKIYGLPYFCKTATRNPHMAFYDTEWLKRVGMEEPKTTDDFYKMLKAFKEQDANGNGDKNDEIPWGNAASANSPGLGPITGYLLPAFTGTSGGATFDLSKDGKVVFNPMLPAYKEFITFVNKLYQEGLLDKEIFTKTSQAHLATVKEDKVGIYCASPTTKDAKTTKTIQSCLSPLTSPINSDLAVAPYNDVYTSRGFITNKCKNPEALMRWFDIWFAKEGEEVENLNGNSLFLGEKGVHWDYAAPDKLQYNFIDPIKSFGDINAKISVNMYIPSYLNFMAYPTNFPLMEQKVLSVRNKQEPYQKPTFPANIRYTKEEQDKITLMETEITQTVIQMSAKFVDGSEPLSKYDDFLNRLKKMGIEELTKIKQTAYDRYVAASK